MDMGKEPLAVRLAGAAAALSIVGLPADVVAITKELIADQLGLQLRGATLPNVAPVARLVAAVGGTPECTVVGSGMRTSMPYAAYANGTFGHACQYDDSHQLAWHPGSCVVPSVLAVAERGRRTGADVVTAVIAGTQVMAVLGAAATSAMQRLGWHGAKVLGVFGAAVGAGLMLGLTDDQLAQAIAIAASDSAGTMEYDHGGGEVKRLHAGSAARAGCEAALLARDGMTAPLTALDGDKRALLSTRHTTGSMSWISYSGCTRPWAPSTPRWTVSPRCAGSTASTGLTSKRSGSASPSTRRPMAERSRGRAMCSRRSTAWRSASVCCSPGSRTVRRTISTARCGAIRTSWRWRTGFRCTRPRSRMASPCSAHASTCGCATGGSSRRCSEVSGATRRTRRQPPRSRPSSGETSRACAAPMRPRRSSRWRGALRRCMTWAALPNCSRRLLAAADRQPDPGLTPAG